jgi:hypothetical protein
MRKRILLLTVVALFALGAMAMSWPHNPPPENFGFQLVYMADGIFDPSTGPSAAELSDWFHKDVMGRSDAEIEAERQKALDYFEAQFGLDLELGRRHVFRTGPAHRVPRLQDHGLSRARRRLAGS